MVSPRANLGADMASPRANLAQARPSQEQHRCGKRHGQPRSILPKVQHRCGRRHGHLKSSTAAAGGTAISRAAPLREVARPSQVQHRCGRRHGHLKSSTAAGGGMASPRASCQRCSTAAAGGTVKAAALPSTGG